MKANLLISVFKFVIDFGRIKPSSWSMTEMNEYEDKVKFPLFQLFNGVFNLKIQNEISPIEHRCVRLLFIFIYLFCIMAK